LDNSPGKLLAAVPVLPSTNLKRTIAFFVDLLGFETIFCDEDSGACERDGIELHFFTCNPDDRHLIENSACRVHVERIDELYERCQARNVVHSNGKLETKPWGNREFTVLEPEGICVTFFEDES
jgi:hypothetical protein